jgi:hypothetical protein
MLKALSSLGDLAMAGSSTDILFPFAIVAASSQALFPLLALFSWLEPTRYAAYPLVYAAGKAVSLSTGAAWLISGFSTLMAAMGPGDMHVFMVMAASSAILLFDAVSLILSLVFLRTPTQENSGRKESSKATASSATKDEIHPELVVDEISDLNGGT